MNALGSAQGTYAASGRSCEQGLEDLAATSCTECNLLALHRVLQFGAGRVGLRCESAMNARMTPQNVAKRLNIGTRAVYKMLEEGVLPGIRIGQRWLITRHAYEQWESTCGMRTKVDGSLAGLSGQPEVKVN